MGPCQDTQIDAVVLCMWPIYNTAFQTSLHWRPRGTSFWLLLHGGNRCWQYHGCIVQYCIVLVSEGNRMYRIVWRLMVCNSSHYQTLKVFGSEQHIVIVQHIAIRGVQHSRCKQCLARCMRCGKRLLSAKSTRYCKHLLLRSCHYDWSVVVKW